MWHVEVTDTFGGEANYCWVNRHVVEVSDLDNGRGAFQARLVRAAKKAEGWTGLRCEVTDHGDSFEVRPRGAAMVMFITWQDSE